MKKAEFFAGSSLLEEVDGSFLLHDLLLDFIALKCQGENALVEEALERQNQGQWAVLGYSDIGELVHWRILCPDQSVAEAGGTL